MRPLERRPQRLVAVDRPAASRRQQPETVVEPSRDVERGHRVDPSGSELDRERHAVEATADLLDRGHGLRHRPRTPDRCSAHARRTVTPRRSRHPADARAPPAHPRGRAAPDSSPRQRRPGNARGPRRRHPRRHRERVRNCRARGCCGPRRGTRRRLRCRLSPAAAGAASAATTTAPTASGSPVRASSASHAPPGNVAPASTAACSARRASSRPHRRR